MRVPRCAAGRGADVAEALLQSCRPVAACAHGADGCLVGGVECDALEAGVHVRDTFARTSAHTQARRKARTHTHRQITERLAQTAIVTAAFFALSIAQEWYGVHQPIRSGPAPVGTREYSRTRARTAQFACVCVGVCECACMCVPNINIDK